MVDPADFRHTIQKGVRAGNSVVVVHCQADENPYRSLVGFVVPKRSIRLATHRNRVKRQLRHLMRERLSSFPRGARVVVRVQGEAVGRSSGDLAHYLDNALNRAWKKWEKVAQ